MTADEQENQEKPAVAGFLGGQVKPEDLKPSEEPAAAPPTEAADTGGGAGFLGAQAEPATPAEPVTTPEAPPEESAPQEDGGSAGFLGGAAAEPVTPAGPAEPAEPVIPAEPVGPAITEVPQAQEVEPEATVEPSIEAEAAPPPVEEPQSLPDPQAPAEAFFLRGEELVGEGFFNSAITAYRRGLSKEPNNVTAVNNLAMIYIELERFNEARGELEQLCSGGLESAEAYNNLGYVLRRSGDDLGACSAYENYLRLNPGAEEAQQIQDWIANVRATPGESVEQAGSTSEDGPGDEQEVPESELAFVQEGERLYDAEDFSGAIAVYNNLLMKNPESALALEGRGRAEIKDGLLEEGVASLKEAEIIAGPSSERDYILGFALRALERDQEAADVYERFLASEPDNDAADKIRAWIDSVRSKESAVEIEPAPSSAAAVEEEVSIFAGPAAEPMASPETPVVEEGAAGAGEEEPAWASALEEAVSVEPEAPPTVPTVAPAPEAAAEASSGDPLEAAYERLGEGDVDGALSQAQALVGTDPTNVEAKLLIARCFGKSGEFAKAKPILKNILSSQETFAEAWFLLGRCEQELGLDSDAATSFRRVAELEPGSELGERAQSLISSLKVSEAGVCSSCLESFPLASLADVNGKPTCPGCREKLEQALGGAMHLEGAEQQVRVSKHTATET
ncbi:MAG: tetratricopeptide repeat protein, partial [Planctomycetota bacterium]